MLLPLDRGTSGSNSHKVVVFFHLRRGLVPSCERHEGAGRVDAVGQHMVRKRPEMVHPHDRAGMAGLDTLILEMVQILHRGMVDHLSRQDDQEVGFGVRRNDERFVERLVEFHQIHAGDGGQVDFIRILHLSDRAPDRAGRNGHDTVPLTRAAAVSDSNNRIAEQFGERSR